MGVVILALCVTGIVLIAIAFDNRRKARKNNEPTGSLWWHLKQEWNDTGLRTRMSEPQSRTCHQANERSTEEMKALNAKLQKHADQVRAAVSTPLPPHEKNRQKRQSHAQSFSPFYSSSPANSVLGGQVAAGHAIDADTYLAKEGAKVSGNEAAEASIKKEAAPPVSGVLGTIRFTYASDGGQRVREVDARGVDGTYLKGFCHLRRMIRTFRFDRIVGDITCLDTGEMMSPGAWRRYARQLAATREGEAVPARSRRNKTNNLVPYIPQDEQIPRGGNGYVAVYFAGFHTDHRQRLERMADAAGYKVRDSLDAAVDLMVTGSMTGDRQLSLARTFDIRLLDEDAFRRETAVSRTAKRR